MSGGVNVEANVSREDYFVFSGENDYYGRVCSNFSAKCDECKWQLQEYRCREGRFRG